MDDRLTIDPAHGRLLETGFECYFILQRLKDLTGKVYRWKVDPTYVASVEEPAASDESESMSRFRQILNYTGLMNQTEVKKSQDEFRLERLKHQVGTKLKKIRFKGRR